MQPEWTPPPVPVVKDPATPRRRGIIIGAGLVGTGVVAGAIIGGTVLSSAATNSSSSPAPAATGSAAASAPAPGCGHGPGRGLGLSGTVTAVGSSSVTIKTSTGTTEYQVDSHSDIDKNGEAKLSDLKVGDAVRFNITSAKVIDKLHAGDEALDRPRGPGPGDETGG